MDNCFVFVDDSNLWIAGKKAQAQKLKLQDADKDPRFRVDLGRLLDVVVGERTIVEAHLFGSKPPPNDSVWIAAMQKNFKVQIFERAGGVEYGREKEVDNAMTVAITEWATRFTYDQDLRSQIEKDSVAFVVVTGDRDMNPAVRKATIERQIRVELWAWKDSIATVYKQLTNETHRLTLREFDAVSDEFTYTSIQSTRSRGDISPNAIVFQGLSNVTQHTLSNKLLQLYRVFFITTIPGAGQSCDMIVEFPYSKVDQVLKELSQQHKNFKLNVCSYPEYASKRILKQHSTGVPKCNQFALLTEVEDETVDEALCSLDNVSQSGSPTDANDEDDETLSEDSDSWSTVLRRKAGAKTHRDKVHSTPCRWGIHCAKASACNYKHTEKEQKLFRVYDGKICFQYWKTKMCNKGSSHVADSCPFAHQSSDAWCVACKSWGHFTEECKSRAKYS